MDWIGPSRGGRHSGHSMSDVDSLFDDTWPEWYSELGEEALTRIQLWKPRSRPWPEWYRWDGNWYTVDGEQTRYCEWDVGPESIVFDVGGYRGEWSYRIAQKYSPTIHLFEPVPQAFDVAEKRLGLYPNVYLHPFALGATNGHVVFGSCDRDGAGAYSKEAPLLEVCVQSFAEFLAESGIQQIDLMSLNIEGGEY